MSYQSHIQEYLAECKALGVIPVAGGDSFILEFEPYVIVDGTMYDIDMFAEGTTRERMGQVILHVPVPYGSIYKEIQSTSSSGSPATIVFDEESHGNPLAAWTECGDPQSKIFTCVAVYDATNRSSNMALGDTA